MNFFYKIRTALSAIACTLCLVQCTQETTFYNPHSLPAATQTGANTFGCLLDGYNNYTKFIADNDLNDPNYATSGNGAWLNSDTLVIAGVPQAGSYFQGIRFTLIGDDLQPGILYNIDSASIIGMMGTDSTCLGISLYPTTSLSTGGTIQLTKFDPVNKIVSGTFDCDFLLPCGDIINATQGRFDYKYH